MTDQDLMLYLKQGEALAFDELYLRYSKRLLGVLHSHAEFR